MKSIGTAITFLQQAAVEPPTKVGVAEAENMLGLLHSQGIGFDRDHSKAITWFQFAAKHGCVDAADNLERLRSAGCQDIKVNSETIQPLKIFAENEIQDCKQEQPLEAEVKSVSECPSMVNGPRNEAKRLSDPFRVKLIENHRKNIADQGNSSGVPLKSKREPLSPLNFIGLKAITLREMNQPPDHVYEGFVLQVTSIEDASHGSLTIALVVEDENGDVHRCFVYNFAADGSVEVEKKLGFGCKISIINPRVIVAEDGEPVIHIDEIQTILFLHPNRENTRCRFCGKSNATKKCSRCKKATYCSKECQTSDWNLLHHKIICKRLH